MPDRTGFSIKAYVDGRDTVMASTLQTARAMTLVVERELGSLQSSTEALAYSRLLHTTSGFTYVLSNTSGQLLVNTLKPYGSSLPVHGNQALLSRVLSTGKAAISDIYLGGVAKKTVLRICVPVTIGVRVHYGLDLGVWRE